MDAKIALARDCRHGGHFAAHRTPLTRWEGVGALHVGHVVGWMQEILWRASNGEGLVVVKTVKAGEMTPRVIDPDSPLSDDGVTLASIKGSWQW